MSSHHLNRRSFLKAGAAGSVGTGLATDVFAAKTTKANTELLKIGIIFGGGNHAQNMWARLINCVPGANGKGYTPRRTGMVISHVWSPITEWAETFAGTFGVENIARNFEDMVGKVDGLIVDAFFGTPYYHHFVKPFLEAGIPVYVNRPFSDSVRKAKQMVELAKKHNTAIMTGSSFEFLYPTMTVRIRYPYADVTEFDVYNATDDFYSHGVHGLLFTFGCVRGGIQAVSHKTESWIKGGGMTYVVYKDRGKGPFIGRIHDYTTERYLCCIKFKDSDQYYGFGPADWDKFMWIHMLQRFQEMFETGSMPDTHDEIVEKTAMFVAAFRSITRENGGLVGLDELDEDWAIGPPWGHGAKPTMEEQNVYKGLFGEEKGELRPDRTYG